MNRELCGIYFRIKRNDKYENICFSDMTENEMKTVLEDRKIEWLKSLCISLGKTIHNLGEQCNAIAADY